MSVRESLRLALADLRREPWRLPLLNAALSVVMLAILGAGLYALPALALLVLVGPLAAALMHCAVTVAQGGSIRLADAVLGLRSNWRRGLALAAAWLGVLALGSLAVVFYARSGSLGWVLSIVVLYVVVTFGVLQLALWPLAVVHHDRPLVALAREAGLALLRRPAAYVRLAAALLLVNLVAATVVLVPLLTVTIVYSFLTAAHFVLPDAVDPREEPTEPR